MFIIRLAPVLATARLAKSSDLRRSSLVIAERALTYDWSIGIGIVGSWERTATAPSDRFGEAGELARFGT
jgi:hypothetical protein